MSRKGKIILISIFASVGFLFFSPTLFGAKVFLPFWLVSQVRSFLAENQLHACDYKDGEIILVKPVATGVGEGRYEAGDIVEIRDGSTMCERFGNGNFLGAEERTMLLPVYYPGKLTEEQKKELLEPEYEDIQCPRNLDIECPSQDIASPKVEQMILHRRQVGVDYTQFLSDREIIKVRQFEKLDRLPEIDLSPIINKKSGLSLKEDLSAVALAKAETKNTAISSDILADFNEVRSPRLGINFSIASQYNLSSFPVDSGLSEYIYDFARTYFIKNS